MRKNIFIKKLIVQIDKNKTSSFVNNFSIARVIIKNSEVIPYDTFKRAISLKRVFISKETKIIQSTAFK